MNLEKYPQFGIWMDLLDSLEKLAKEHADKARKAKRKQSQATRCQALKPGPHTPLWHELSTLIKARFWRRGDKTNLGRFLGLPRQRIHKLLVEQSACPDAERTLLLLVWLRSRLRDSRFT